MSKVYCDPHASAQERHTILSLEGESGGWGVGNGDRAGGGRAAFFTTCNAVLENHFQFVTGRQEPLWAPALPSHSEEEQVGSRPYLVLGITDL